jgi:RHS repeat-associated protein
MGGGVGGLLYSKRGSSLKYNLSNGRGDIVAQADQYASLTWTASYEAYGKRTKETGTNLDKQRGNSKDEDPTGLLNEGFRYRDIETGIWLSRDPAGFVDGPNIYAYVKQNPWTGFDPKGLATVVDGKRPLNQPTSSGKKTSSRGSTIRDDDPLPDPRLDEKKEVPQEHPFFDTVEDAIEASAREEKTKEIPELRFADAEIARAVQQIAEKDYQDRLEADPLFAVQETIKDAAWMALDIALTVETGGSAKTLTSFAARMKATNSGGNVAYRAINPQFAESTAVNGFYRSGAAGRLGNDGIYANSTIEGAIAEFGHHNPGITPAVFEVRYPASTPLRIDPPSGYFNQPLPFTQGSNIIQAPSLRASGTTNLLIRDGAVPGIRLQ